MMEACPLLDGTECRGSNVHVRADQTISRSAIFSAASKSFGANLTSIHELRRAAITMLSPNPARRFSARQRNAITGSYEQQKATAVTAALSIPPAR